MFTGIGLINRYRNGLSDKYLAACVAPGKHRCKVFALRILDKSAFKLFFKLLRFLVLREQRYCLDIDEPCRHFKEIGSVLKVLVVKLVDIFHILLQQQRYLDIVYIQFVLGDKVKEQVKRSFKHIQLELCTRHFGLSFQTVICT